MITMQDIKAYRIDPATLLTRVSSSTWNDVLNEPVRLCDLTKEYATQYIRVAIDEICKAHKRVNEMMEDERDDLARRILRRKSHYTIGDISYFTDLVISCELGDALKSVDAASILEKMKEYDRLRSIELSSHYRKQDAKPTAKKLQLTEWQMYHTYLGTDMTGIENWDAEMYWNSIASPYEIDHIIWPIITATMNNVGIIQSIE